MLWDSEERGGRLMVGLRSPVESTHSSSVWRMVEKPELQTRGGLGSNPTLPHNKLCASKRDTYCSEPQFPLSYTQGGGAVGKVRIP